MKKYIITFGICAIITLVTLSVGTDEPTAEQQNYCEMVDIWNDTQGEYGWPDYNDNFNEVCEDE